MIRTDDNHVFFYKEWLSNFRKTDFTYDYDWEGNPHRFFCTEQAFMYSKARFFNDLEIAEQILVAETPMDAKVLGRAVRNYVDRDWYYVRYGYMKQVNYERFTQDLSLRGKFLNPEYDGKEFVEASPEDLIWGIGIALDDDAIFDENNWRGMNLLGKVLTELRKDIKMELRAKEG